VLVADVVCVNDTEGDNERVEDREVEVVGVPDAEGDTERVDDIEVEDVGVPEDVAPREGALDGVAA